MDAVLQRPAPRTSRVSRRNAQERDDGEPNVVNVVNPPLVDQPLVQGPQQLRDSQQLCSVCDSLGLHLSAITKSKIHKGEFVDLGSLLTPPGTATPSFSFSLLQEGQQIMLGQQMPKPPTIITIMKMVRGIVLTCLTLNISIKSEYIEGRNNCIADFLSRFQMDAFRRVAPEAERTRYFTPIFL